MYAYIKGTVEEKGDNYAVLETGGVGYKIFTNTASLTRLTKGVNTLFTHLIVREEEQSLYGFCHIEEKNMFIKLIGVSGIGPKVALSILSALTPNDLAIAVITSDEKTFQSVSGVGKKTAQRIIIDLKEKVDTKEAFEGGLSAPADSPGAQGEAVNALASLGYARSEALKAVAKVANLADTAEDLILLALKRMGSK